MRDYAPISIMSTLDEYAEIISTHFKYEQNITFTYDNVGKPIFDPFWYFFG